jgi:hypothetical protein
MQSRRWQVKDTVFGEWRELPGLFTSSDILHMRRGGKFCVALPVYQGVSEQTVDGRPSASRETERWSTGLSQAAQILVESLAHHVELTELPAMFPHILNELADVWAAPSSARKAFGKLLFDVRWGRQGLPPMAFKELVQLFDHYWNLYPAPCET